MFSRGGFKKAPDTDNKVGACRRDCRRDEVWLLSGSAVMGVEGLGSLGHTVHVSHAIKKQEVPFFLPTVHSLLKSRTVSLEFTLTSFPQGRPLLQLSISSVYLICKNHKGEDKKKKNSSGGSFHLLQELPPRILTSDKDHSVYTGFNCLLHMRHAKCSSHFNAVTFQPK